MPWDDLVRVVATARILMAIGAGWAGARSMTSTSGPGISLMAEFSGLGYSERPRDAETARRHHHAEHDRRHPVPPRGLHGVVPGEGGRRRPDMVGLVWRGEEAVLLGWRNVWKITPKPFRDAHFATFPPDLVERCLWLGTRMG